MMVSKKEILKDLKFCQELMNRLVDYTKENYVGSHSYDNKHTVIQNDIIRLRRELNDVIQKLNWDYEWRDK